MPFGILAPLALAALALISSITGGATPSAFRATVRIVDVRGAASLVARGATVLDARDAGAYQQGHVPGAQAYHWPAATGQGSSRGRVKLDEAPTLARNLATLGVDAQRPALVYGGAHLGWGEEGHLAWLLQLLGHTEVAMLDGGFAAWRAAGRPVVTAVTRPRAGAFEARLRPELRASREEAARARQFLDVRSAKEFAGATPYGESRGGHAPGARHLDWRALLDDSGRVLSAARVEKLLVDRGIDPGAEIVTACTSGVRSAYVCAVLGARGVSRVRNYDGSMLEWSADPNAPLER